MRNQKIIFIAIFTLLCGGFSGITLAATNNLLGMLTSQLGITEQQATQGMASLINLAKQHLSTTDYTKLISHAPDLDTLAKAAAAFAKPQAATSTAALLGYAASMVGGETVNQMVQMAQIFSQWGLSVDMVGKFLQIALDYVNSVGGPELKKLLADSLKF